MNPIPLSSSGQLQQPPQLSPRDQELMNAAKELEATFLAEMLKSAGMGKSRTSFGGGAGEDQFTSLLVNEQARAVVQAGGIGLAQSLFEALKGRDSGLV